MRFGFAGASTVAENLWVDSSGVGGNGALVQAGESATLSGTLYCRAAQSLALTARCFSLHLNRELYLALAILPTTSPTTVVANGLHQFTGASANTYTLVS